MLAALAFMQSPFGKYLMLGLAALAIIGGFYGYARHQGAESVRRADAKAHAAAVAQAAVVTGQLQQAANDAGSAAQAARVQIVTRTQTVLKVIHDHPPSPDVRLDAQWVFDHDAGLSDASLPASGPEHPGWSVAAADAIAVVAQNYGTCRADQDRLNRLIDFYGVEEAKVNGSRKRAR